MYAMVLFMCINQDHQHSISWKLEIRIIDFLVSWVYLLIDISHVLKISFLRFSDCFLGVSQVIPIKGIAMYPLSIKQE